MFDVKHGSWGGSSYKLVAYFLYSLHVLLLTKQEDNLKQWELESCPLLVTEEPKME